MDRHRRALPSSNKVTEQRYTKRCQDIHKQKLRSIKSTIDNKPPKNVTHLKRNLKKEQIQEDRYTQIERENRILLEKMSHIMQTSTLDNVNSSRKYVKSLNKERRKRELERITKENEAILRRIQAAEPAYDHQQWEEEARKAAEYSRNISEY